MVVVVVVVGAVVVVVVVVGLVVVVVDVVVVVVVVDVVVVVVVEVGGEVAVAGLATTSHPARNPQITNASSEILRILESRVDFTPSI
jgi:hypothetical protein